MSPEPRPQSLYFAFGSNLHLSQVAHRCPNSRYIGTAILHDYKWQINQRGYANVVRSPGDDVQGLCYLLSKRDEERLDVNEGVAMGAYEKEKLDVEVAVAGIDLVGRRVVEILESDAWKLQQSLAQGLATVDPSIPGRTETASALVYASSRYVEEGTPREEYVDRMNLGIMDAVKFGVSENYVQRCVRPYVPDLAVEERYTSERRERKRGEGTGDIKRVQAATRERDLEGAWLEVLKNIEQPTVAVPDRGLALEPRVVYWSQLQEGITNTRTPLQLHCQVPRTSAERCLLFILVVVWDSSFVGCKVVGLMIPRRW